MKIIVLMITILMFAINSACASHVHQMILFSLKAEHSSENWHGNDETQRVAFWLQ